MPHLLVGLVLRREDAHAVLAPIGPVALEHTTDTSTSSAVGFKENVGGGRKEAHRQRKTRRGVEEEGENRGERTNLWLP